MDVSAVATEDSVVEFVARDDFTTAMVSEPGLHLEVVRMLSLDVARCYELLKSLPRRSVRSNQISQESRT